MKNSDLPAMPNEWFNGWGEPQSGLTKREHFAAMAMQGILASGQYNGEIRRNLAEIAEDSIHCANSLLAELEATK